MAKNYPEHEKLHLVKHETQTVADFIAWLEQHNYYICEKREPESPSAKPIIDVPHPDSRRAERLGDAFCDAIRSIADAACIFWPTNKRLPEALLSEFFEIDPVKLEEEKMAMLEECRKLHETYKRPAASA